MRRAPTTAIQAPMVRARPARGLERLSQGAAGAVEPDRCVIRRDPQVAGHQVERFFSQLYPTNNFGMLRLQGRNQFLYTRADGGEERLVYTGRR